ncbi:PIN domain-containing protein [Pleurocapsales cyanobacterium LEGE 06147]|nr:PIN domain-containing protein [Pleurocapsales cyanobacterium LEGE 06147]
MTRYLVDTNLLLRSVQLGHSMHAEAVAAMKVLLQGDDDVYITSQNLIEFWNVCTRPLEKNGLGMTPVQAGDELTRMESIFSLLPDTVDIYSQWRTLVSDYSVMGINVHDARLVAVMLVYGLTHILTFNTADFRRYAEITVIHPNQVIAL